ncbi:hypothetical protein NS258_15160, partial [Sphingomonas sanguinis]
MRRLAMMATLALASTAMQPVLAQTVPSAPAPQAPTKPAPTAVDYALAFPRAQHHEAPVSVNLSRPARRAGSLPGCAPTHPAVAHCPSFASTCLKSTPS